MSKGEGKKIKLRVLRAAAKVRTGGPIVFIAQAAAKEAETLALQGFLREDNPERSESLLKGYYMTERGETLLKSLEKQLPDHIKAQL